MRVIVLLLACLLAVPLFATEPVQETSAPAYKPDVEPGTSRAWALLTCSVLWERNHFTHDQLAGFTIDAKTKAEAIRVLKDDWYIETYDDLMKQLDWVRREGHRKEWEKWTKELGKLSAQELENRLKRLESEDDRTATRIFWTAAPRVAKLKSGLLGWDLSRYVSACRWAYGAGLITEPVMWELIEPVAKQIQKAYSSWEELGLAYCAGRELFRPGKNADTEAAFETLKTGEKSPWKTTAWNLKLVKLDKPEKAPPAPKK